MGVSVLPLQFIVVVNVYVHQYMLQSLLNDVPCYRFSQHVYPHFFGVAFCKLNFAFVAIIFCQIFIALMCSDRGVQDLLPLISILSMDSLS